MNTTLKKMAKKKWNIEHYDGCPAFIEMTAHGFTKKLYNSDIPVYKINLSYFSEHEGDWMSLYSDQKKIGSELVKKFIANKNEIINIRKEWVKNFEKMAALYYKIFNDDLRAFSDDKLLEWVVGVYSFYKKISMPGFIDGYMFYADKRFDFLLKDFCAKSGIKNQVEIFSILSAPTEPSFISEEDADLYKIVKLLRKGGFKKGVDLRLFLEKRNAELGKMIFNHLFKYSWIKSSYAGYKEYSFKDLEKEVRNNISKNDGDKKIFKKNKEQKKRTVKKYKFTPEILAISDLTEIFTKWQDQRKIYTLTFVSLQDKILREISRRKNIDFDFLRYCHAGEIIKIIRGEKPNIADLKKRIKSCLFVYKNGEVAGITVGKDATDFFRIISKIDIDNVKEICGMTASLGRAIGKVKIVTSAKYIDKVNKGDILVAPMTRPEHLLGMKKAAAIVTDDGGITCHASIISRELGIPCIIGTKIATKVLKDGDLVEVDAERGIVRILN